MNMRSIAQRAGVSSATVSRVINGSPLVREETARRVREIIEEVNFVPNPSATTLKYGRSRTFGLVIPDIRNPFFAEFLAEFESLLIETDHELLVTNVHSPEALERSLRRMMMRQVDGAVFMSSEFETEALEALFLHKLPLVTIDRRVAHAGCSDVAIDFEAGFLQAIQHLKELGHTRIGYLGGMEGPRTSQIRFDSFQGALKACKLRFDPGLVRGGDYRVAGGETAMLSLMEAKSPPSAVVTANDLTAFGAIRALHTLGLRVPADMSVVGLDDVLLCEVMQPALTTIRVPRKRMAEACVRALHYTKENVERRGVKYTVPTELVVRESTAKPRLR